MIGYDKAQYRRYLRCLGKDTHSHNNEMHRCSACGTFAEQIQDGFIYLERPEPMIGEPEVRLGAGDAAVWATFILLAGTALGWVVGRITKR